MPKRWSQEFNSRSFLSSSVLLPLLPSSLVARGSSVLLSYSTDMYGKFPETRLRSISVFPCLLPFLPSPVFLITEFDSNSMYCLHVLLPYTTEFRLLFGFSSDLGSSFHMLSLSSFSLPIQTPHSL